MIQIHLARGIFLLYIWGDHLRKDKFPIYIFIANILKLEKEDTMSTTIGNAFITINQHIFPINELAF
jgi:hypothetical protein